MTRENLPPAPGNPDQTVPFRSAEEAWFWFVAAQQAKEDGARFVAGQGRLLRPCLPVDIFQAVNRLYRQRRLLMDHLMVLRHYGRRFMSPDPRRVKEVRAHGLWVEAMNRIEPVLEAKGIVDKPHWFRDGVRPASNWARDALVYERAEA